MHGDGDRMIRAAGGVLWRLPDSGAVEVALVHRPRYDDWSLPKGKLRRGEHPLVTACREVAEETGVQATAGKRLDIEHYDTALGPKAVEYWVMHGQDSPFTPTAEVDRLAWLSLADALLRLRYRGGERHDRRADPPGPGHRHALSARRAASRARRGITAMRTSSARPWALAPTHSR